MDTSKMEYTAEDLISYRLQRSDIFVAKPIFDLKGTDLLAFIEMDDGVKFCRIQCKGRTVKENGGEITIKKSYVTKGFIVFLYVDSGVFEEQNLYCFFSTEIKEQNKWRTRDDDYVLSIKKDFKSDLSFFEFNESKIKLIKLVISTAQNTGEFRRLIYGEGGCVVPGVIAGGTMDVSTGKNE